MFNMDLLKLSELLKPKRSPTDPYGNSQAYPDAGLLEPDDGLGLRDEQFDKFVQLMSSLPRREDYEPSKGRRFAAFMAGLGAGGPVGISSGAPIGYKSNVEEGLKNQRAILDEPYDKALFDWGTKAKPSLEASKLENTRNVNERISRSNLRMAEIREQEEKRRLMRDETLEREGKEKLRLREEELKVSQQRQAINEFRSKNPNHVYKEDENGNVYSINPQTDKVQYITDPDGDKIKSSNLPDAARIEMNLDATLTGIEARAAEARRLEDIRQGNRLELKTTPGAARTGSSTTKQLSPAAARTHRINRIISIVSNDPSLKKYFVYGGNRAPTGEMVAPKSGIDANYEFAKRLLESQDTDAESKKSEMSEVKEAPKAPVGWKYVPKAGGGWTAIEDKTNSSQPTTEITKPVNEKTTAPRTLYPLDSNRLPEIGRLENPRFRNDLSLANQNLSSHTTTPNNSRLINNYMPSKIDSYLPKNEASSKLTLSPGGLKKLQERELLSTEPYQDAGTGLAIGYGMHNWKGKPVTSDLKVTEEEINKEMERQLKETYIPIVDKNLEVPVTQEQYDALISMAWNAPKATINLIKKLNKKQKLTEEDFQLSATVKGSPHKGLSRRRKEEFAPFKDN